MPCITEPTFEEIQQEKKIHDLNKRATELLCSSIKRAIYEMDPFDRNFPTLEELEWFLEHRTVNQKSIQNGGQAEQDEIRKDIKKAKSVISALKLDSQIIACIRLFDGVTFTVVYDSVKDYSDITWNSLQLRIFKLLKDGKLNYVKGKLYLNEYK